MAEGKSFWSSLPGILTALAGLITAIGGLLLALREPAAPDGASAPAPLLERLGVTASETVALRGVPTTLAPERLAAALTKNGLFDAALNPAGAGVSNRYEVEVRYEARIVRDAATGLVWQVDGSRGLDYAAAEARLDALNAQNFAGYSDWRLPTAEEASSLMEPAAPNGRHIDDVFGSSAHFIWTADRSPDGKVYVAFWVGGRLSAEQSDYHAWLRAVR
jgi:hypothetical protein